MDPRSPRLIRDTFRMLTRQVPYGDRAGAFISDRCHNAAMPWLLYRFILLDLLRIIGLTTMVLVTVIAFGATLKPLGDSLLEPMQVLKYLGLAIVPMLQFALPFSAGFGATLCLHRMTTDNEIQAMAVSGLSYRRILAPIVLFGIVLMLFMVVITQWVIPRFWSAIEQMVSMDVTKMFQASIRRGEPFKIPDQDIQIYAEEIFATENPEGPDGPQTRLTLAKVAAAKLSEGRVVTDVTGNQAVIDLYRREGRTYLKMVMADAMAFNAETRDLMSFDRVVPTRPLVFSSVLTDNPKALTRTQLLALRENPDDFSKVMLAKDKLADAMRDAEARNSIDIQLRDAHQVVLIADRIEESATSQRYIVMADRLHNGQFGTKDETPIEVLQFEGENPVRRFVGSNVQMLPTAGLDTGSRFDLVLGQHKVFDVRRGGEGNERAQLTVPNLSVAELAGEDFSGWTSRQLLDRAQTMRSGPEVPKAKKELIRQIDSLNREITSRLLARHALSTTALLLLVLGAVLAMWQRGSLPLTVYAWAFLPAVIDLILISAGEQVLRDGKLLGHFTMWSGNVIMFAGIVLVYLRLSRH